MSIENERYVSNRVDRIEHLEEVIRLRDKQIALLESRVGALERSNLVKDKLYEELLKDYNELRDYR